MPRDDRDDDRDTGEQHELPAAGETERPLVRELDEVVEESDRAAGERGEDDGQRLQPEVAHRQEGDRRRAENQQPAHRRRALLGHVVLRAFLADVLAELVLAEKLDEPRSGRQGDAERDRGCDEDADHAPPPSSAFATTSSPTDREPLTRIASPGRTSAQRERRGLGGGRRPLVGVVAPGELTDAEHDVEALRLTRDLVVVARSVRPQLGHLAQDRDRAAAVRAFR